MLLKDLIPVLPVYQNQFKTGPYKNGSFRKVNVHYGNQCFNLNDLDDSYLNCTVALIDASPAAIGRYAGMAIPYIEIYLEVK